MFVDNLLLLCVEMNIKVNFKFMFFYKENNIYGCCFSNEYNILGCIELFYDFYSDKIK